MAYPAASYIQLRVELRVVPCVAGLGRANDGAYSSMTSEIEVKLLLPGGLRGLAYSCDALRDGIHRKRARAIRETNR